MAINNPSYGPLTMTAGVSPNLSVGGMTAISTTGNKIVLGQTGCDIEIAGNLVMAGSRCAMCNVPSPVGVLLSGKATRVLFCFDCAKQHLHGSVKELVDALDVKHTLGESA